jgi:hypothetical protein
MGWPTPNVPLASHPVRSRAQRDQRFGWVEGSGAVVRRPRGGDWVEIGDHSVVGQRLFSDRTFSTGDQNGRVRRR